MKLRKVKLDEIKVPETRVTAQFDDELYEQFKESIKVVGQVTPPICYEVDGELVLCDGLHRLQEATANGEPDIRVIVLSGDMVDVLTKNIMLDHLRGKTPVSQMVKVIGALYQEYSLDPDQIGERTGLSRNYIEKLIKIAQAAPSVLLALDEGVIGVGHAAELARLPYPIQQEELIAKHQVWRYSVKELHEQIDAVLQEMELIAKAPPAGATVTTRPAPVYNCEGCKHEIEPRYLRPVMLCPECFGNVWRLAKAHEHAAEEEDKEGGGG